jgi:micrococcal nuclease
MEPYIYRAECLNVVDGDTVDLHVDQGFHSYRVERFRLLGVNTPELHSKDEFERARAQKAKDFLISKLSPVGKPTGKWPLIVKTTKSDSFGRWLCELWLGDLWVNKSLLDEGLAVPFKK